MILIILKSVITLLAVLISIAYLTIVERKVLGQMQRRLGPTSTGFYGTLQPFADALKLFIKEIIVPVFANGPLFFGAPIITFACSLIGWVVIPFGKGIVLSDLSLGILYSLALSSLGVYGLIFSGWAAGSMYALIGSLRSTCQMISYEIALTLLILTVLFCSDTPSFSGLSESQNSIPYIIPLLPVALLFGISMLAETNRAPFDLPEAESELVSGFFTEHSAFSFAYFFLGEYGNMILLSVICCFLFFWGYSPFIALPGLSLGLKVSLLLFTFVWVRGTFPRFRYDGLMLLMWKSVLPLSLGFIAFVPAIFICLL